VIVLFSDLKSQFLLLLLAPVAFCVDVLVFIPMFMYKNLISDLKNDLYYTTRVEIYL
jgi:hypothetical protein